MKKTSPFSDESDQCEAVKVFQVGLEEGVANNLDVHFVEVDL